MRAIVFSIAQNGYAALYRPCLRTQAAYCHGHGYEHVTVARPLRVPDPALSAWLKVPLLLATLRGGYDVAVFIDADCRIAPATPSLDGFLATPESLHMALGRSGRHNSGVIVARGDEPGVGFLERAVASVTEEIPAEDRANLKYENGNLIWCARTLGGVGTLDARWNNSQDPELDDFVRHYTGPMRDRYRPPALAGPVLRAVRATIAQPSKQPERRTDTFRRELDDLTQATLRRYPALAHPPG